MATEGPCASPTLAPEEPPARLPRGASLATKKSLAKEEEEEDLSPITVIQQHLQGGAELVADRAEQLCFLHAVPRLCFSAQKQGRDTLEPPVSKAALVESIVELIENLPGPSEPSSIMPSSMAAVCSLSKLKPPLALELESHLLRALLNRMCTLGTGQDTTHFRALHNNYSQSLDILLRGLLTETPTMEKLQHLLEHIHHSLLSNNTQERARAVQTSAALLQFATSLSGFDSSSTSPRQANLCCSWVSGYPTQPVTSASKPGVGSIGFTGSCFRRGGSTPERHQTCGAGTGSMTPSAWGIETWPGWERSSEKYSPETRRAVSSRRACWPSTTPSSMSARLAWC
ncbi:uncharacterized protein LOC120388821 [Mauremys reevesii]|uniref:uncharacterized protein LOC120388821 n=1 Tax=Mauremys reevesii TaxID=260615 RepID=UPI00193EF81D|nr:uncharacterized protein LOC120388821 [Mauremys reevesii]